MAKPNHYIPHFRTNVFLKNIIGNELINNDNIAILELVKNSFDAGSKEVQITFENIKENDDQLKLPFSPNSSKIIVQDWGSGMNRREIIDNWLNIAYSQKKEKKKQFGRIVAGAKGIGRFSTDRLGKYLNIYSKKRADKSYVHLQVNWTEFETTTNKNLDIQEIPVKIFSLTEKSFQKKTGFAPFQKGTIIEIIQLREQWATLEVRKSKKKNNGFAWNFKPLIDLKKYLEKLINPNQVLGDKSGFNIFLCAKEFAAEDELNIRKGKTVDVINGKVENKIFEKLNFHTTSIEAFVSDNNKTLTTILNDKGRAIYTLVENISGLANFLNLRRSRVYIFFLNTYAKSYFKKQTGISAVNFGSIFLFKNGFRIPPYGEEGDDWLGLERRKGQGQRRFLGTRDIVGRVELYDTSNTFREVTSREGLVENKAFEDLKGSLFFTTLKRLEKYVVEGLNWDSIPQEMKKVVNSNSFQEELFAMSREEKDRNAFQAISSIIRTGNENIISLDINSEVIQSLAEEEKEKFDKAYQELEEYGIKKIDKNTVNALKEIKNLLEAKEREISQLKEKAYLVESDQVFSKEKNPDTKEVVALQHHINQGAERIDRNIAIIKNKLSTIPDADVINSIDRISFETKKIATLARFVTKAKFNVVTTTSEQDIVSFIMEYVEHVYKNYADKIVNKQLVDVVILIKQKFEFILPFRPLDIIIVIDNLLDNAYKAGATLVQISINKLSSNSIELKFNDNGKGLDSSILDENIVFEFGFTTSTNGTGIGLYHVKSVIEKMKGSIQVLKPKVGLEFRIVIKK